MRFLLDAAVGSLVDSDSMGLEFDLTDSEYLEVDPDWDSADSDSGLLELLERDWAHLANALCVIYGDDDGDDDGRNRSRKTNPNMILPEFFVQNSVFIISK